MQEFRVKTDRRSQLVDVTKQVRAAVGELNGASAVLVYVPHTTAGITINEHADPAVARDFEAALERIVSADWPWQHVEEGRGERADPHPRRLHGLGRARASPGRRARARHLAGHLPLRVRRPARALDLRDCTRLIEVVDLSKRFGKTQAVAGLSFRVEPGTITGFLGPNGAGKSTTLRSVLGLVHPDAGSATVLGQPYRQLDRPLHRVGAVLEASEVHPGRSGRNHLRVQAAAAGLPASRVEEVLTLVELSAAAKRRVKGYSLGMRQRLGLATALLGDPEVLVLDEPANGLDPAGIRWLRDLLRSLAAEGRTVLVSSHVLSEVAQTADRVVIIHRGRLIQQASVAEVLAGAQGATRVRTPDPQRLRELLAGKGASVTDVDGALAVDLPPEQVGELAAANGIVLHELTVESATLEEVFLELTGGETTE